MQLKEWFHFLSRADSADGANVHSRLKAGVLIRVDGIPFTTAESVGS